MRTAPGLAFGTVFVLSPAALVGAWGLVPSVLAVPVAAAALVATYGWLRRREVRLAATTRPRSLDRIWLVLLLLAFVQLGRVGVFVVDPDRREWSALPMADDWAVFHTCFSGYTEAVRLAREGGLNIYDGQNYETPEGRSRRIVGRLRVDEYEYPPPFLPLPALLSTLTGHEFLRTRALFFGLQGFALVLAMVATAMRLPPSAAGWAWRLLPGVLAAFQTVVGLQYGNFQAGAFALAVSGMLALTGSRAGVGAPLLGFAAASKIFPGLLLIPLVAARRWRAVALTIAWGAAFAAVSFLLFGVRPYADFVFYQLSQISTGAGFAWANEPYLIPTNYGMPGLVLKLGALGLPGASFENGMTVASIYGLIVIGMALFAAWKVWRGAADVMESPLLWLALLNLASFRSPYVADAQATMGTLWLLALVVPLARWNGWRLGLATSAWIAWALTFEGLARSENVVPLSALTLVLQVAALGFNTWIVITSLRTNPRFTLQCGSAPGHHG